MHYFGEAIKWTVENKVAKQIICKENGQTIENTLARKNASY